LPATQASFTHPKVYKRSYLGAVA